MNESMIISIGASRRETNWKQQTLTVSELFDKLEQPVRSTETLAAYRKAFGHRRTDHPRTCVFFGTCNNADFLQDTTGNRRFWPVDVNKIERKKNVWSDLDKEIDQLWAEAKMRWQLGESLFLSGEVEAYSIQKQEEHREESPLEGRIAAFLDKPIPHDWRDWSLDRRLDYWAGCTKGDDTLVDRNKVCVAEIMRELLKLNEASLADNRYSRQIRSILDKLGWVRKTPRDYPQYGKQRIFERPFS